MSNNNSNTTLNFHNEKDLNDEIEVTEIKPNTSSLNIDKRKKVEYQTSDISIDMIVDENDSSKDIQNIKRSENKSRNVIVQKIIDFFNSLEKIYCPDDALENLKNYKYNSVDKSFISKYILKPYWEFCTRLFPLSMAYVIIFKLSSLKIIV